MYGRYFAEMNQVSKFLASYCDQLRCAYLPILEQQLVLDVALACKNSSFHLFDCRSVVSAAALAVLGVRLEEITISGFEIRDDDDPEWVNAWDKCINLRKLTISNCKMRHVETMFATPKEQLKVLSIDMQMVMGEESMKKLMEVCAEGTKCVEELIYGGQPFYRDTAERFFEKNRRSLTSVTVSDKFKDGDMKLSGLLDSFLKLPALEHLNLDGRQYG